jgi:hypothetical protein
VFDIELRMGDRSGELARMGEALGRARVSVEGGGMFLVGDAGVAHFLVADGRAALAALDEAGMAVAACREVLSLRLDQDEPGQLGKLTRAMAEASVNIEALYSDHDHRLILLVDDPVAGRRVRDAWQADRPTSSPGRR